ncbi:twin-arginine translocation signal domain-containing protein [Afifella marina]|uniref:Uncharacterized protein n=1 Tax=Afifella marina DSM 2698 TaxID=1120955 RepID=A0A1G5NBA1_AFIMA|nr:twin-arginine translocation signal domain-containing protein [Afifella marina]MBK1623091.1 hypothetical protein [Afifella marina DSM 2698]MBK1626085.1 hypothetical protein [Afifella marina]MBK5916963.1 hypothetical protein [Afifella marina]RAI21966.1 hypothetical protein CH311_04395 [Afifella marina DSM 2698]SCZ34019.1 hypothetical protein SAMN03080610_01621 [Afifella marina DSM 2698]
MNRRDFLLSSGGAAVATMMGASSGYAFDLKHSPESVYDNLSRALWASTNRQSQKAAYVIAAPWCGVCRALYQAIREQAPDCDFRFVWQNDRSELQIKIAYSTYFHDGDNQLIPYQNNEPKTEGVSTAQLDLTSGINETTISSVGPYIRPFVSGGGGSSTGFGWGYPTIIYKSQGRIKAVTGLPPDMAALVASIDSGLDRPTPTPELLAAVREPLQLWKTREGNRFAQEEKVLLYAAPLTDAPVVEELERGRGYPAYTETDYAGHRWLGLKAFGETWPIVWGKVEQF